MIKQLPARHAKALKEIGGIEFRVEASFARIAASTRFLNIPHRIVYVQKDEEPQHLFDCTSSFLDRVFTVNDIMRPKNGNIILNKAQEYLFLGLVVDAAEDLAKGRGKVKIVITSHMPSIADILIDRDFVTRARKTAMGGYRGVKMLNIESEKNKDENDNSKAGRSA